MMHATAIAINGYGVLIIGPSGAGKSDLALRLIDRGAMLISDDAVLVETNCSPPLLKSAPNIEGKLEVRRVGIVSLDYISSASLRVVAELSHDGDRLPIDQLSLKIGHHFIPMFKLDPFEVSAAIKVEYALRAAINEDFGASHIESREQIAPHV